MSKKNELENSAHYVDVHVGRKLRELRRKNGVSQDILAQSVGLTFQQVQKYEKGLNRISCSKLHDFAKFLRADVKYFFDGLDAAVYSTSGSEALALGDSADFSFESASPQSELAELIKAFQNIKDGRVRMHIVAIVRALAA